jgi:hypothetical protein
MTFDQTWPRQLVIAASCALGALGAKDETAAAVRQLVSRHNLLAWSCSSRARPTVRLVKWFCRIRRADSSPDIEHALELAEILAKAEFRASAGLPQLDPEPTEWLLAYRPWATEEAAEAYEKARRRDTRPVPSQIRLKFSAAEQAPYDEIVWSWEPTERRIVRHGEPPLSQERLGSVKEWKDN